MDKEVIAGFVGGVLALAVISITAYRAAVRRKEDERLERESIERRLAERWDEDARKAAQDRAEAHIRELQNKQLEEFAQGPHYRDRLGDMYRRYDDGFRKQADDRHGEQLKDLARSSGCIAPGTVVQDNRTDEQRAKDASYFYQNYPKALEKTLRLDESLTAEWRRERLAQQQVAAARQPVFIPLSSHVDDALSQFESENTIHGGEQ